MTRKPVVILTALDSEYDAVRQQMQDRRFRRHPQGTQFELGKVASGRCQIALALVGKGNGAAAIIAERAITEFDPTAVFFVGVAGALRSNLGLGDIVVATHIYAYHGATSEDDGRKSRPRAWEIPHAIDQLAREVKRNGEWMGNLSDRGPAPSVHFGPIAAGEMVIDSKTSADARWLLDHYNDAMAVEMEGAGVAQAAHLNRSRPAVVIRAISDRADGTKQVSDRERWQERAVQNAAAFAVALAERVVAAEPMPDNAKTSTATVKGTDMRDMTRNIASGNARVGMQAGNVRGDVKINMGRSAAQQPKDLTAVLASLRAEVTRACASGELDEDTRGAAEGELDMADDALTSGSGSEQGKLVLALKKVRGLVADVADAAALAALAITLAQAMS
ncbi:5'-methylthioadenosine/S-adenosylhomocysteine nucleosidase [Frankia sp. AgB1.9]|uniref:5'-methylthioadenosine/S-adenosylhomocysteine nucleosidase family protein n=1 Tax=unclassified Frankia TaxID=2632575 RepID=UPI0019319A08|nr:MULTISPECIES: 5'-methylthioadenosine/S-adenosylhomocysteine nucleosidase [unclassified Frankia]MBL7492498.1 5'-methylthioadenosine/S-adenosylhomocysteine nucleosidase [Frankia sp. AgW1.1]MBL7547573.1 5'-methylthioadenosine/S-adenosylhomocysteine nucleosidase [Frankia sp. AgB1.9]MBL7619494.1 5'-methylthioadenosine/S-adenosylhomocysteine nucleosidase [Frankia sp. AgB1.8]